MATTTQKGPSIELTRKKVRARRAEAQRRLPKRDKGQKQMERAASGSSPSQTENTSSYRTQLLEALLALSPPGFERVCQCLLSKAGFEQVVVTGRSGDGGLDGHGILHLNPFVSLKVAFQSKRYQGAVSAPHIRDFRGAMQGRADKGIIITTGTFTTYAVREACRDGAPPIELVDGQKLIEIFQSLKLGLKPVKTYELDSDFFAQFGEPTA